MLYRCRSVLHCYSLHCWGLGFSEQSDILSFFTERHLEVCTQCIHTHTTTFMAVACHHPPLSLGRKGTIPEPSKLVECGDSRQVLLGSGCSALLCFSPPSPPEPLAYLYALLPSKPSTLWQGVVVFNMRVQTERTPPGFESTFRESVCLRACVCIWPRLIAWR